MIQEVVIDKESLEYYEYLDQKYGEIVSFLGVFIKPSLFCLLFVVFHKLDHVSGVWEIHNTTLPFCSISMLN